MQSPDLAKARALMQSGNLAGAIEAAQRAVRRSSADIDACTTLGVLLMESGKTDQGLFYLERAAATAPARGDLLHNLGLAYTRAGRPRDAAGAFQRAVSLNQPYTPSIANLMLSLGTLGKHGEALALGRDWLVRSPDLHLVRANVARILLQRGQAAEAVSTLRDGLALAPGHLDLHQSLLNAQEYTDSLTAADRAAHARALGRLFPPAPAPRAAGLDRDLVVGFISPDLRDHSVAYFFESILTQPQPGMKYLCYSTSPAADHVTARLRAAAHGWCAAAAMPDEALAARIRADRIDVLVDLAGHTAGGRAALFARRAAPVQVSYLGWAATTGLPAMDYRIVDVHTDPAGSEHFCTEQLIRLDPCFLCYHPPTTPDPHGPPRDGPVRFGSFNALSKVSPGVLDAWSQILQRTPGSTLSLKAAAINDGESAARLTGEFSSRGIDPARLVLMPWANTLGEHLSRYLEIDIALDTFPYNGTTTTCESLWMGVPVVSLAGESHAGRVGVSLLHAAGTPDLIAPDRPAYVDLACRLASDCGQRASLHAGLRDRMKTGPLCDAASFGRTFAAAIRRAWRGLSPSPT